MTARVSLLAGLAAAAVLAAGCGSSARPRPDIAFVSTRGDDYAIYGMNADGGREQRLSRGEEGDASSPEGLFFQVEPAWSPDGRTIAFSSKRDGRFHIFVMQADGSGTQRLTSTEGDDEHPTWSPDGRIAFSRGRSGDIYVMSADGTGARRVGSDPADERDPAWSPDGRWIAYARRTPGTTVREIWLIRPDGSERRALTKLGAATYSPAWSPDGRTIAFSSDARAGIFAVYTIRADGKGLRRVTSPAEDDFEPADGDFEPAWSPDGTMIAFTREGTIVARDAGGREVELSKGENDVSPAWRPPTR